MSEHFAQPLFPSMSAGMVRRVQQARRARATFFAARLFADPAWDILLELYACELSERRVATTALSEVTCVPVTTTLRWLSKLEADGIVVRTSDPLDARRQWVELSRSGLIQMQRYFAAVAFPVSTL